MKIIEKFNSEFEPFEWLNFDYLPDSAGYKFELYPKEETSISEIMMLFYSLFKSFLPDFVIGQPIPMASWGDFCIDTWDVNKDNYDYSIENKSEETADYLKMLVGNEINPEYTGLCFCHKWDVFLPIVLKCILSHKAPYSIMLYSPTNSFVLYFHHTGSFGVYYEEFNEAIKNVLSRIDTERCVLKNYTDDRIKMLVR